MNQKIPWTERLYFGALDWARGHHDVVVVDKQGAVVAELRFDHTIDGWQVMKTRMAAFGPLAIAIETNQGLAVEQLLEAGFAVYPVNPRSARRYRERKAPTGIKDDRLDAWSLADALRVDGHGWRLLEPDASATIELRALTRDEVALIQQRTGLVNQLIAALKQYYPNALPAFDDWTLPQAWAFVEAFPTPQQLVDAGRRRWEKFLHLHGLWRCPEVTARRFALFEQATRFQGTPATNAAKSALVLALVRVLRSLQQQIDSHRDLIEERFADHPDQAIFSSLPGVGPKLGPRLLAEIGSQRDRFDTAEGLQAYAGTAPVTFQSGQVVRHFLRRACSSTLRDAVHHWANNSRQKCAWAEAYYQAHRAKGKSHAGALRCLGQRWLKILWKMWQNRSVYDEALHTHNQTTHGSWVLALDSKTATG